MLVSIHVEMSVVPEPMKQNIDACSNVIPFVSCCQIVDTSMTTELDN